MMNSMVKVLLFVSLLSISCSDIEGDEKCLYNVFKNDIRINTVCIEDGCETCNYCANYSAGGVDFEWTGIMCGGE